MIRNAASKVMWVGRATVFLVGLAVILALVFGVVSRATAHDGFAGLFHLGHNNPVTALSTLTKSGAGPALSLKVDSGAPLAVNSATKVANLNADRLDGKNSTDFATAYKRTVVVSPVGTDTQNGTALLNALTAINDASATKKYLLYIEPGTYDLGSGTLFMKEHVDIQGAGELNTLITSGVSTFQCVDAATVEGANNAELRFLTVRNTGTGSGASCTVAIMNVADSPRLTHVTAEATGSVGPGDQGTVGHFGVFNAFGSSPIMTDVTATASGVNVNYGVRNRDASPTIRQSKLSGSSNSLLQESSGNAKVALTQLVGPVTKDGGTLECFNNYDQNMAAVTCP